VTETTDRQEVSLREALHMELIINQGLIELLVAKGAITHEELMDKIKEMMKKMGGKAPDDSYQVC
jgi:hypothetical protein